MSVHVCVSLCVLVCVCVTVCLSALGCFMHAWVSFCVWMLGSTAYWWVGLRGISCGCSQPSTTILMSFELGTYSCTLDLPCWTMLFTCLLGSAWFNCAICSWEDLNALCRWRDNSQPSMWAVPQCSLSLASMFVATKYFLPHWCREMFVFPFIFQTTREKRHRERV